MSRDLAYRNVTVTLSFHLSPEYTDILQEILRFQ
jgi:hypothetical protein